MWMKQHNLEGVAMPESLSQFSNRQLLELMIKKAERLEERVDNIEADVKTLIARDNRYKGAAVAISFIVSMVIGILGIWVSHK
jgi:uncharacterized protein (UPF0335 family)